MSNSELEIERKFLVGDIPSGLAESTPERKVFVEYTEQCYLSISPEVRIRKTTSGTVSEYCMATKTEGHLQRIEREIDLLQTQYDYLKDSKTGNTIEKERMKVSCVVEFKGRTKRFKPVLLEIDIFKGNLKGLRLVEVEFSSQEEAAAFIPPYWFGREVTYETQYKNKNLAKLDCLGDLPIE